VIWQFVSYEKSNQDSILPRRKKVQQNMFMPINVTIHKRSKLHWFTNTIYPIDLETIYPIDMESVDKIERTMDRQNKK